MLLQFFSCRSAPFVHFQHLHQYVSVLVEIRKHSCTYRVNEIVGLVVPARDIAVRRKLKPLHEYRARQTCLKETHRSVEHQLHHTSKRINVRLRRVRQAGKDLWRTIPMSTERTVSHITTREIIRMTEVSKDHVTVRIQEDVLWLDVPVHPVHPVELRDRRNLSCVLAIYWIGGRSGIRTSCAMIYLTRASERAPPLLFNSSSSVMPGMYS